VKTTSDPITEPRFGDLTVVGGEHTIIAQLELFCDVVDPNLP
jgi:hypothetical protein